MQRNPANGHSITTILTKKKTFTLKESIPRLFGNEQVKNSASTQFFLLLVTLQGSLAINILLNAVNIQKCSSKLLKRSRVSMSGITDTHAKSWGNLAQAVVTDKRQQGNHKGRT